MMRHLVLVAGFVGLATLAASAQNATLVQAGKALYVSNRCARCHSIDGKGYKNGKLDGVVSKMTAADMKKWLTNPAEMEATLTKKPKVKMSSRKNMRLSDTDVTALIAYLRTIR
jgi:mono/diheme cytochrome c family protein